MQNSGTKLVLALISLAFLLGVTSWWYRYEAVHRASQFWGPTASRLITESDQIEAIDLDPKTPGTIAPFSQGLAAQIGEGESTDLSRARGQAHLRHALLSDRNYVWGEPLDVVATEWRWCLRFHEAQRQAHVLLSDDLSVIGKYEPAPKEEKKAPVIKSLSCEPMTESLVAYFRALKLLEK